MMISSAHSHSLCSSKHYLIFSYYQQMVGILDPLSDAQVYETFPSALRKIYPRTAFAWELLSSSRKISYIHSHNAASLVIIFSFLRKKRSYAWFLQSFHSSTTSPFFYMTSYYSQAHPSCPDGFATERKFLISAWRQFFPSITNPKQKQSYSSPRSLELLPPLHLLLPRSSLPQPLHLQLLSPLHISILETRQVFPLRLQLILQFQFHLQQLPETGELIGSIDVFNRPLLQLRVKRIYHFGIRVDSLKLHLINLIKMVVVSGNCLHFRRTYLLRLLQFCLYGYEVGLRAIVPSKGFICLIHLLYLVDQIPKTIKIQNYYHSPHWKTIQLMII